jgi:prepilin-type N-terminal cleavage/methylation domain-containing protein
MTYALKPHRQAGFTIIELAIALTIVAFIVGGLAVPISTRIAEQQYTDTQANIDRAVETLVGFAINNRRLPCPDVNMAAAAAADNRDGLEDTQLNAAGAITGCAVGTLGTQSAVDGASWGDIPWRSLGLQPPNNADAWNNRLRYAVFTPLTTQAIAPPPAVGLRCATGVDAAAIPATIAVGLGNLFCQTQRPFTPATSNAGITAALDIRCANPIAAPGAPAPGCLFGAGPNNNFVVANNAVFVVYSHGANGWGATNARDLTAAQPFLAGTTSNDDLENIPEAQGDGVADDVINARRRFVVRARSNGTSNAGEFDDVLTFMSANTLAAKLLAAGVWP